MIAIGTYIGKKIGKSWQSDWNPLKISSKVLFWGKVSEIAGGQMPNKITGATDFLTVAGSPYTFQTPNTVPYIAADTDYIWFKTDSSQRTTTTAELIGYDFPRTIVKYLDVSPYTLQEIMILKAGEILTTDEENAMRDYMHLSRWWSNVLSFHGYVKENRNLGQSYWYSVPPIPTDIVLTLISGGVKIDWTDVSKGQAKTEIYGQSDGAAYALLYTINEGIITKNDTGVTPVDLRYYKLRTTKEGNTSDYSDPISIAMLSAEIITNGGFTDATGWTVPSGWSIGSDKASFGDTANATLYQVGVLQLQTNDVIRQRFTIADGGTTDMMVTDDSGHTFSGNRIKVGNGSYSFFETIVSIVNQNKRIGYRAFTSGNSFSIDDLSIKKVLFP